MIPPEIQEVLDAVIKSVIVAAGAYLTAWLRKKNLVSKEDLYQVASDNDMKQLNTAIQSAVGQIEKAFVQPAKRSGFWGEPGHQPADAKQQALALILAMLGETRIKQIASASGVSEGNEVTWLAGLVELALVKLGT